ncbi:helix-turn-helix domain-containing protein [Mycobacterium intracellulare]|uniref:helix-turn-helix transcriptional regulator n=1 Tax=Mycobacterium intracellulare TaxID=1767 RepID=UPI001CD9867E|nr:helix-turn-helix domain-containing protein [Mycobacterium intracellulare]MCA2306448.1 helix-turn-helix domain-containing protein [Mycobacterium intracellulare]MCA2348796.1 helix-turn-helix domain-containing protein [Mycobacterium intracellulare]
MSADTLLSLPEAADYLGYSPAHLYRLRSEDRPPASHKRHGKVYYYQADLDAHVARTIAETTRGIR